MKFKSTTLLIFLLFCFEIKGQVLFEQYFVNKSLRVDFALSGNFENESAALSQMREEPVWGGPVINLVDTSGYGGYYVNLYDKVSGDLIYSRGFNTLFEEWRTTGEAMVQTQSWINSISVPYPHKEIVFELQARQSDMEFHPLLKFDIDPSTIHIDRSKLAKQNVTPLQYKGESHQKVDLVFLAEGYTKDEQDKFIRDAQRFSGYLFQTPPFDKRQDDFNVWAVGLESMDSGTDIPGEGIYKNTILNAGFYTFDVERYLTSRDMKSIRDAVWNVPCDAVFILVNTDRYGGSGMYNMYAMGTADNEVTSKIFVHELGHSFAGLADEYFTSDVAYNDFYNLAYEPWEPNITTLVSFDKKWKDLLPPQLPVPTPLEESYKHDPGVFEGGGYMSKGIYRPMDHCMMRDYAPFCPVCSRAINRMIDFLTDK